MTTMVQQRFRIQRRMRPCRQGMIGAGSDGNDGGRNRNDGWNNNFNNNNNRLRIMLSSKKWLRVVILVFVISCPWSFRRLGWTRCNDDSMDAGFVGSLVVVSAATPLITKLGVVDDESDDHEEEYDVGDDDIDDHEEGQPGDVEEMDATNVDNPTLSSSWTSRIDSLRQIVSVDFHDLPSLQEEVESSSNTVDHVVVDQVIERMTAQLRQRLSNDLYSKATSPTCRAMIAEHLSYFVNAIGMEQSLPFTDMQFPPNECGETNFLWEELPEQIHPGDIQNRTYQPPRDQALYIDHPSHLKLCYAILIHDHPQAAIRLIEALTEPGYVFVVHVDAKEQYKPTQTALVEYAATRHHVHVLPDPYRVRANWGGFSMVIATLQILQYAFGLLPVQTEPLHFHKFVHLAGSSYPLASNLQIQQRLASFPLDANFLNIIMQPQRPNFYAWQYFVECDDALQRIYQLPVLTAANGGVDLFTSSQWFIASREFASYLAKAEHGTFAAEFAKYAQHVVVADETYFGTVLRHSSFCHKHHNRNFLHLQFDRWESELPSTLRDPRKCLFPDRNHCGRSPTIMTLDYVDMLELSDELFARKFDDSMGVRVKDIIDAWRYRRDDAIRQQQSVASTVVEPPPLYQHQHHHMQFEGHGVLIVARETVLDDMPLCMGLGETGNRILLTPCFESWVPRTLAASWDTGAVIIEETRPHTRWHVGPCTTDGSLERLPTGEINVTLGNYSLTGPRCMLKQMDGIREGRCYDCEHGKLQPGGHTQVYPCLFQWFQFVAFGDGRLAPPGSLYSTIPTHTVKQIHNLGHLEQIPHMCLGVYGRGNRDEVDWNDPTYEAGQQQQQQQHDSSKNDAFSITDLEDGDDELTWEPLSEWSGQEVITTQCTNIGAVIEWLFVPFIDENEPLEVRKSDVDDKSTDHVRSNDDDPLPAQSSTLSNDEL